MRDGIRSIFAHLSTHHTDICIVLTYNMQARVCNAMGSLTVLPIFWATRPLAMARLRPHVPAAKHVPKQHLEEQLKALTELHFPV